jgi:hypothetical protein
MTDDRDRATFLALCAAEDYVAAGEILAAGPPWASGADVELAAAIWVLTRRLSDGARADLADARQCYADARRTSEQTQQQQAQMTALLDQLTTMRADFDAAQTAADDLDVFQAGYERGYAQGWQHRGDQGAK